MTYPVPDLIIPIDEPDTPAARQDAMDGLIDLIVSTVEHESWLENGTGEGEIQPFMANNSLVISQTGRVHDQIADLFEQLRRLRTDVDAKETIPLLQALAATERQQGVAIRKFGGSQGAEAMEQLFDSAVASIADRWGQPDYCGAATDGDFPSWSVAQRVATWPKGDGVAYLAVQDDAQAGRVLLAGWHAEE
jgi:hypothetical protein